MHIPSVYEPRPYRSSALQLFKHSNEFEIHAPNQIMLDFYPVLPHLSIKVVSDGWEVGGG